MKVDIMPGERGLIACLLAKIHKLDPDLLVASILFITSVIKQFVLRKKG